MQLPTRLQTWKCCEDGYAHSFYCESYVRVLVYQLGRLAVALTPRALTLNDVNTTLCQARALSRCLLCSGSISAGAQTNTLKQH